MKGRKQILLIIFFQILKFWKLDESLSRHQILKAIVKYKTHPSIIINFFSLHFSSFYFSQVDKKIAFLKTSRFYKVVQESDPYVRILKKMLIIFLNILMVINRTEGEDASKSTRLIYSKIVKSLAKIKK